MYKIWESKLFVLNCNKGVCDIDKIISTYFLTYKAIVIVTKKFEHPESCLGETRD